MRISFLNESGSKIAVLCIKPCGLSKNIAKKLCPILDTLVSGSPIIQDGKLVDAVTHVLVNDPTTGYGIFIENMLDATA